MKMATMNISLPGPMAEFVRTTVERDYGNASEFFRDLVREEIHQQVEADVRLLAAEPTEPPRGLRRRTLVRSSRFKAGKEGDPCASSLTRMWPPLTYDKDLLDSGKPFGVEILRPSAFLKRFTA